MKANLKKGVRIMTTPVRMTKDILTFVWELWLPVLKIGNPESAAVISIPQKGIPP